MVVTPSGNLAVVYVLYGAPAADQPFIQLSQISSTTKRGPDGTTLVTMTFWAPNSVLGSYPETVRVTSLPQGLGTSYAYSGGQSGTPVVLHFTLDTP